MKKYLTPSKTFGRITRPKKTSSSMKMSID